MEVPEEKRMGGDPMREPTPIPPATPPAIGADDDEDFYRYAKSPRMEGSSVSVGFSPSPPSPEAVESDDDDGTLRLMSSVLQNPVILTNLFELCPVKVLANFRLVSKLWHDLSLSCWRSSVCVIFDEDVFSEEYDSYSKFWSFRVGRDDGDLPFSALHKFSEFVENPRNECASKPYRHFRLKEWEFRRNSDLMDQFWNTCANTITTLELDECYFYGIEGFRKVVFDTCPNLQRLVVKDYKLRPFTPPREEDDYKEPSYGECLHLKSLTIDMDHEQLPVTWMEVFSHFPRLTTLKLFNAEMEDAVDTMLKAIKIIRKRDSRKLSIKHLDILSASLYAQDVISNDLCALLKELRLPLESLTLDFGANTPITIVKDILEMYAPTLRMLNGYRGPISLAYTRFPFGVQMDALHELYISDRLSSNMEFIKFMPNLKVLHIRDSVEDHPPQIPTKIVYSTWEPHLDNFTLVHLTDFRMDYIISEEDLRSLIKWMPNLEKLRMNLNDKQFSMVCGQWKNLIEIHVNGTDLTDEGITGRRVYIEDTEEKEFSTTRPNITFLKGLRSFIMDNEELMPTKLLEASAFNGFLKLENLQYLRISTQMGDKARQALMEKIPRCEIIRMVYNVVEKWWDNTVTSNNGGGNS